MSSKNKKELLKKYKEQQRDLLIKSLPFSIEKFKELFDYLDEKLSDIECDNTLKYTLKFLKQTNIPIEKSIQWLKENGGYCDCEVLANIEDKILEIS